MAGGRLEWWIWHREGPGDVCCWGKMLQEANTLRQELAWREHGEGEGGGRGPRRASKVLVRTGLLCEAGHCRVESTGGFVGRS